MFAIEGHPGENKILLGNWHRKFGNLAIHANAGHIGTGFFLERIDDDETRDGIHIIVVN